MFYFILTLHILLCVGLIGLVMLQQGKGADMGPAFGSGGSNTIFGAAGATSLIVKLTAGACILFMITSVLLIKHYQANPMERSAPDALRGSVMSDLPTSAPAAKSAAGQASQPVGVEDTTEGEPAVLPSDESATAPAQVVPVAPAPAAAPAQ